jgi:hypothetical protein
MDIAGRWKHHRRIRTIGILLMVVGLAVRVGGPFFFLQQSILELDGIGIHDPSFDELEQRRPVTATAADYEGLFGEAARKAVVWINVGVAIFLIGVFLAARHHYMIRKLRAAQRFAVQKSGRWRQGG